MSSTDMPFMPDWISPPGDTIDDLAEELGWNRRELACQLGYAESQLDRLIHDKVPLTVGVAQHLERVLGGTTEFWLAREASYRQHLARLGRED